MKFETMISGIRVTGCKIELDPMFDLVGPIVSLTEINEKITREESVQFIFTTYRFIRCEVAEGVWQWCTIISRDDLYKIHILERRPEYEEELYKEIGDNWMHHYLRFDH